MPLTKDEKASITSSLTMRIPELTHHLKHLQVVINFLSLLPTVEGDNSLSEYMKVTFGREVSYLTERIKLKHVRDVWLLIKYTQADLLMRKHQVNISLVDILGIEVREQYFFLQLCDASYTL